MNTILFRFTRIVPGYNYRQIHVVEIAQMSIQTCLFDFLISHMRNKSRDSFAGVQFKLPRVFINHDINVCNTFHAEGNQTQ